MAFKKPAIEDAYSAIRSSLLEIRSPYNDGWTQNGCKYELYLLKCWLNDEYSRLPVFSDEHKWEQRRVFELLKKE